MSNVPISVDAFFNLRGEIRPRYVCLQDEETHQLSTYKIEVEYAKEENYSGISTVLFGCFIERNGCQERIKIRFHRHTTQWVVIM